MFDVTFYNFEKRNNSVKRPDDTVTHVDFKCRVLNGTGILNPKIELDIGLTSNPARYNYAYIPDFQRYYYVREWNFDRGLWIASLEVDVLATYKRRIGMSTLYVLRASGNYDGNIMDGKYPVKAIPTYSRVAITNPYTSINSGCFVIGVVSKGGNFGSLTYHALTAAEMAGLCRALIDPTIINSGNGFSLNDASAALQLNLIDPMQYIKSCVWLPIPPGDIPGTDIPAAGETGGFDIFNWHLTGFTHRIISNSAPYVLKNNTVTLKNHPQKSTRGNYMQMSPYTIITLSYPPFGVFQIDTSAIGTATKLYLTLQLDVLTGSAALIVKLNSNIVNRVEAQVGVPIVLSQVTKNWVGAASEILGSVGSIANSISSFATGNVAGGIGGLTGAAQGIINGFAAVQPRANTIGSGGGFAHLQGTFEVDYQFFSAVDDDLEHNGRPLCQLVQINQLSGFILVQDGDVITDGTSEENNMIRQYLETGFYFE